MPNFGDGYPGKRYEDAACETAWNFIVKTQGYLAIETGSFFRERLETERVAGNHQRAKDFPTFRAAFMEWCAKAEMRKTNRGFIYKKFRDIYKQECSIQKSSLATQDCIWLGVDNTGEMLGKTSINARMHLTRAMVKRLLPLLQNFAETGELN